MKTILLALVLLAACGDDIQTNEPDAGAAAPPDANLLPSCESLGCPATQPLFCTSNGTRCSCPTDAGPMACQRGG